MPGWANIPKLPWNSDGYHIPIDFSAEIGQSQETDKPLDEIYVKMILDGTLTVESVIRSTGCSTDEIIWAIDRWMAKHRLSFTKKTREQ